MDMIDEWLVKVWNPKQIRDKWIEYLKKGFIIDLDIDFLTIDLNFFILNLIIQRAIELQFIKHEPFMIIWLDFVES